MISVIIPSRGRPNELLESLNSLGFEVNKKEVEVLVWLDTDDPKLKEYQNLFSSKPFVKIFIKDRVGYQNMHTMLNFLTSQSTHEWVFGWSDDAVMENPDWYTIFQNFVKKFEPKNEPVVINIWGQGDQKFNLFPIVSRKFIEILGYYAQMPCDEWVRVVAIDSKITHDLNGIRPNHRKYDGKDLLKDTTFYEVESQRKTTKYLDVKKSPLKELVEKDIGKIKDYQKNNIKSDFKGKAKDLSILIPARNEMFLTRTIEDILQNIEADTEVIAVLDGAWAEPPIPQHERVNVIYLPESVGQRAATNIAAKLSKAKYVMKLDAHCAFDKGFDTKMLEAFKIAGDNTTMVPIMRNLWAFDWKCYHCGWKKYQGPTPKKCEQCGKNDKLRRKMIWIGKERPQSTSYSFDTEPHFQYFGDWKHRPQYKKDKEEKSLTETMSLQGSCFMATREKFWELELSDEKLGNWGNQGIEVAAKTWLSGGRVLVNHKTWYAHMFRTQGGDFGFPWQNSGRDTQKTKNNVKDLFWGNHWHKQKFPLSWLLEKFWPVPGWTDEDLAKLKEIETQQPSQKTDDIKPIIVSDKLNGVIYMQELIAVARKSSQNIQI